MTNRRNKILQVPLWISMMILMIGLIFKLQHWVYSNLIITVGFTAIAILYFFRFWMKTLKSFLDYIKLILVVFWSMNGIFTILHLPYKIIFQIIASISFLIWFYMEGFSHFEAENEDESTRKRTISKGIYGTAAIAILFGLIFKIQHWPWAALLLSIGLVLIGIGIARDIVLKNR